ncbi:MAG TPA: DegT/DnrJ/EryC1/StrS family aminotransferase [Armatimonadaceae bacterium]|nr:DegT/DnrJ/EryC1/StrS family aminotransferase [Armatimonadaceae bacterium]
MTTAVAEKAAEAAAGLGLPAIAGGEKAKQTPYGSTQRYGDEELQELREALDQGTLFYAQGQKVRQLEEEFAAKHGAKFAVTCTSGTAAIHIALIALGISPGDEVIVPPITDMGTLAPVLYQGAVPVFADLTPHGYALDPASVEAAITERTRAVIAVHLWGNACDLNALRSLCDRKGVFLVEDCAQAFGCTYEGKAVGTFGHVGCYSYNEFKHISCGDGGIVLTDDPAVAKRLRLATDKCYDRSPDALVRQPTFLANNYRMTELQGAVARAQLRKLDGIVARRRAWCSGLLEELRGTPGIRVPEATAGSDPSWWFFLMRVVPGELGGADADAFAKALAAEGVRASAHYIGKPIYQYPIFTDHSAFERGGHAYDAVDYAAVSCPVAEAILETGVMLPVNEGFTETDRIEVARAVKRVAAWFASGKAA